MYFKEFTTQVDYACPLHKYITKYEYTDQVQDIYIAILI